MLKFVQADLFDSPAQTLVNTVNTVGVMGKGIAKEFKARYPAMYRSYRKLCDNNDLDVGMLHLWRGSDKWVLNFPTKTTWRKPSKIEYIESGLKKFKAKYEDWQISSVAFPPLGCGNGDLDWGAVKPLMLDYLSSVRIPIYIYEKHVSERFVPEHKYIEDVARPTFFSDFITDIARVLEISGGDFATLTKSSRFHVSGSEDSNFEVFASGRTYQLPVEMLEEVWSLLHNGIVTNNHFNSTQERKINSYVFPLLASLPYVDTMTLNSNSGESYPEMAIYMKGDVKEKSVSVDGDQTCLFPIKS